MCTNDYQQFIEFFVKTGAFDQYLQKLESEALKKKGKVVIQEKSFWDSIFTVNFPTNDLTEIKKNQLEMK